MIDWREVYFIHIIESPSDDDILNELTEGKALASALELGNIEYCYNLVTTQKSLEISLFDRLINVMIEKNKWPILHFSMHGNEQEIVLTNGQTLKWHELYQKIMPIKNISEDSEDSPDLLICMSSCYGSFAKKMAEVKPGEIPFDFLVGNIETVEWRDALVAYITFYHLLFKGFNFNKCIESMKAASDNDKFEVYDGEETHLRWIERKQKIKEVIKRYRMRGFG
jgi:hypothetical protein